MRIAMQGFMLAVILGIAGCSGDPGDGAEFDTNSDGEAFRGGDASEAAGKRAETILVSLSDNSIHRLSTSGKELGVFAQTNLNQPLDIAVDRTGNVYVASVGSGTIEEFSPSGEDRGAFATLQEPSDLAFDRAGNLFVSDIADNTVQKFSPSGALLGTVVSLLGVGCPAGLAVDRASNLFVADECASVVRMFSPKGASLGVLSAGLSHPGEVAFDGRGHLFVANSDNGGAFANTIHEFSAAGEDLGTFASAGLHFPVGLAPLNGGGLLVANESQRPGQTDYSIRSIAPDGADRGDFIVLPSQPRYLAVVPAVRRCRAQ